MCLLRPKSRKSSVKRGWSLVMASVPEMERDQFLKLGWDRFLKRRVVFLSEVPLRYFQQTVQNKFAWRRVGRGTEDSGTFNILCCQPKWECLNWAILLSWWVQGWGKFKEKKKKEQKIKSPFSILISQNFLEEKVFRCSCLVWVGLLCSTVVLSQMNFVF